MHIYHKRIILYVIDIKVLRQTARETNERYQKAYKSHNTVETSIKNTTSDLLFETQRIKENLIKVINRFMLLNKLNNLY